MKEGIIYPIVKKVYQLLDKLSFVEFLKKQVGDNRKGADFYIIFKWIISFLLLLLPFDCCTYMWFSGIILFYLWIYNIFTYLKYHLVKNFYQNDIISSRRRLINIVQAFLFNNVCFTFFYAVIFRKSYSYGTQDMTYFYEKLGFFLFSMSNSLASTNYSKIVAVDIIGDSLVIFHLFVSFSFIATLFTNTINKLK